jgi:hypothetical protein
MASGNATTSQLIKIHIPFKFRRSRERRQMVVPEGYVPAASRPEPDTTMVKALARAHRWKRMLEGGEYASMAELAAAEKINQSYLCRILRLTLLAPDIVEGILDGQLRSVQIDSYVQPFPPEWTLQRTKFGVPKRN